MGGRLALSFPWLFLVLIVGWIWIDGQRTRTPLRMDAGEPQASRPREDVPDVARDPVCGMTVRTRSAHSAIGGGETHYFCSRFCREEFVADPKALLGSVAEGDGHTMRGIPGSMYQIGVALVLVVSFGLFEMVSRLRGGKDGTTARASAMDVRWHVTSMGTARRVLRWHGTRFVGQLLAVAAFLLIIAAGLFGNQNPAMNIAPLLTWTIWWVGLVFVVLFFGKAWCYVCPWDALATWIERLKFWGPRKSGLGLEARWPSALRNIWLAVTLFLLLTWVELGMGITTIPRATAWVALAMLGMAVASVLIFHRKAFCRYACLVGRVSGLYSLFSSTELRALDPAVCTGCEGRDCYQGSEKGDGCPTFEFPRTMKKSTYCILCGECIKTCPEDNVGIRLRPWGADLATWGKPRTDEAFLAVILLAMTGFHGLTMTPKWTEWNLSLQAAWGVPGGVSFAILMSAILAGPILVFALLARISSGLARSRSARIDGGDPGSPAPGGMKVFIHYAYALLPIALFYHLAHNAEHFLMEGPKVAAMASDPFGWGWNLFGTSRWVTPPLITLEGLWIIQVALVLVGHLYGLWVAAGITRRLTPAHGAGVASQIPMLAAMIMFSTFSLWLLKQPMEMRLSAM